MTLGIGFPTGEQCGIIPAVMPRQTVSQRLAAKLKALFKHGDRAALVAFSHARPSGMNLSQQNLTYFLNPLDYPDRPTPINLDDLDDIADFLRLSVGELFDIKQQDLSGDEQRIVLAFRALAEPTREHFLALVEAASVTTNFVMFRSQKWRQKTADLKRRGRSSQTLSDSIYGGALSARVVAEIASVAARLTELSHQLAEDANRPRDRPTHTGGPEPAS